MHSFTTGIMREASSEARYIKIAQDICERIVNGEYPEGSLIKGRSVLAAQYHVSPETIRKSIHILEREGIIRIKRGVGIFVISLPHAKEFQLKFKGDTSTEAKYDNLLKLIEQAKDISNQIDASVKDLKSTLLFSAKDNIQLSEIVIPEKSWIDGRKIGDVYFYNYTEATIVAVIKASDQKTYVSVGPDFVLNKGDKLVFATKDKLTFDRVTSFLVYGVGNN